MSNNPTTSLLEIIKHIRPDSTITCDDFDKNVFSVDNAKMRFSPHEMANIVLDFQKQYPIDLNELVVDKSMLTFRQLITAAMAVSRTI